MAVYVVRRLFMALVIVVIVISVSFFMVRVMPGNPMAALEAQLQQQGVSPQEIQAKVNAIYGVVPRGPLLPQYLHYMANVFQGNLGRSITNPGETVMQIIAGALPWTIFVVATALIISFVMGIGIGALMAAFQDSRLAKGMTFVVSFLGAIPNYLIAIVLLYVLADLHNIFPLGGAYSVDISPGFTFAFIRSVLFHGILPIATYVITSFGGWALAMKGTAVSVLGAEYVRAADSRGLSSRRVAQSYVGRNAMLPQVTSLALAIGFMFGGSVFIETYFTYPGIGYYLIQSVDARDYSLMMGCFLLITVSVVLSNFLVDLLYPVIDPRIANPAASKGVAKRDGVAPEPVAAGGSMA